MNKVKELETIIEALDTAWDLGMDCVNPITGEIVLDNEYDALIRELKTLNPKSKIFEGVTSSKAKLSGKKIVHNPPMTSINKCNGTQAEKLSTLIKWVRDTQVLIPIEQRPKGLDQHLEVNYSMSYKHDGIAVSLEYEDGKLVRAGLRSKSGQDGINVTKKMKYVSGIPQKLPLPLTCTIRGELETPVSVFKRVSKELGANAKVNPRAHTAGSMILKTAKEMKDRGISFTGYNILNLENPPYKTEVEREFWAKNTLKINFVKIIPISFDMLKIFEEEHRRLDFMVDGAVLSVNDLEIQEALGKTGKSDTGNPKGKLAWKFADEVKEVIIEDIIWQTGRVGNITPVLTFKGVQLEGTTVSKCTAHNVGIIKSNKIGIGSRVAIIKSGKIIPKIKEVIESKGKVIIPKTCPSCDGMVEEVEGANDAISLVCSNPFCSVQKVKNLNHFLTILGVKGIAESTINKLVELGLVKEPGDFYTLTVANLVNRGITKRTAVLIVARVWMIESAEEIKDDLKLINLAANSFKNKISIPVSKFFAAFGMKNAGKEAGRILEKHYKDWYKIKEVTEEEINGLDGIGPIMAKEIVAFFRNNDKMISNVETHFEFENIKSGGILENKTFVLSGSFPEKKSFWKDIIEQNGGIVKGSVGKSISYLVAGEGSGSKSDKANKLGISIIDTKKLEELLKE